MSNFTREDKHFLASLVVLHAILSDPGEQLYKSGDPAAMTRLAVTFGDAFAAYFQQEDSHDK